MLSERFENGGKKYASSLGFELGTTGTRSQHVYNLAKKAKEDAAFASYWVGQSLLIRALAELVGRACVYQQSRAAGRSVGEST